MASLQAGNNSNHFLDLCAAAFFIQRYFQFAAQGSVMARVGRDFISFGRSGTQSHGAHPHPDAIQAAGDAVIFAQRLVPTRRTVAAVLAGINRMDGFL